MKNYSFQDLMLFGMFILALLTLIFQYCRYSGHKKTTPTHCPVAEWLLELIFH